MILNDLLADRQLTTNPVQFISQQSASQPVSQLVSAEQLLQPRRYSQAVAAAAAEAFSHPSVHPFRSRTEEEDH